MTHPTPTSPISTPPHPWLNMIWIGIIIVAAILLISVITIISAKGAKEKKTAKEKATVEYAVAHPSTAPTTPVEALVLMYEGITPCSTKIDYRAQIWGDGPDFWVQFPGFKNPILYTRGKFMAPDEVEIGETFFKAADPARPVVVRVYKKNHCSKVEQ